ncbi:MAG: DUF11 domain-containing protein [Chitinispirillaceae bacterium]|nr:DUF11 domain-containing protein [Chitinispirillaceae bacterium]
MNINSGNPAYPFPQFQPYKNPTATLRNLGTNNAVGVTHAEMEKTIREAYQIQMNRASKPGGGVGGKDYIKYASSPQCSEGDGYGLLGAAAMADKETFDGMWLYIHDFTMNKVKRYSDCRDATPGYAYSQLPGWTGAGANSAADGDFDIALALLQAHKQWGDTMGIKDACGNLVSYKQAAIDFLTALTDTMTYAASGSGLLSGDIGLDGYMKGGDSWGEMTAWAGNAARTGFTKPAQDPGPKTQHFDYAAPAYFTQFADFLAAEDSVAYAWNIYQFRRAAASSDWIMGKLLANPAYIPFAGDVTLSAANQPTFTAYSDGEDFRLAWRTILNYMWHGNPSSTWDPVSHQVLEGTPNSFERDIGLRYAKFLWNAREDPWNNACEKVSNSLFQYWGPSVLKYRYSLTGEPTATFVLNWVPGTGSPSAVALQDFNLMAELYRTCETTWDATTPGDGYLTSVPFYFHGWFRLLGLLVLSGNYQSPSTVKPGANVKVYCAIDKTFAFERDTVTYTIDYRNYGSLDAAGTVIVDTLHKDFQFVSATKGGVYNNTAHTVTWNVGNVPGFKTATKITPTTGQVELKVIVKTATEKQYRNRASISCSNGTGWTSNEYPNNVNAVMQRNYLDIARRALILDQTCKKDLVKPGDTVEFALNFLNSSEAGWINGGRSGVRFSFAFGDASTNSDGKKMRFRLFHDAHEAYIDYGNYRVSYFMYDPEITCYSGDPGCTKGWGIRYDFNEGVETQDVKVFQENIVEGQDSRGKWNQRIVLQFSDPLDPKRRESLSAFDYLVRQYYGNAGVNIHRGGAEPLRLQWELFNSTYMPPRPTWSQHWSWDAAAVDVSEGSMFSPVTNDWTDPDNPDAPVDRWHPKACSKASHTIDNILVEEWDGYTWRRVAGNGPMPGREANNVVIRDTVPEGFTFVAFTGENPLNEPPQYDAKSKVITWKRSELQIREGGTITFTAKADGSCPTAPDRYVVNRAWISADKESPFADSSEIGISCDTVIKPPPADHIDIVLDTIVIDSSNDNDFVRITMDEGTQTAVAYAVVRDRNGKFIRRVTGGLWTSRDGTVATAAAAAATSWQGIITKTGGGSTIIVVSEPGDTLKPDTLAITTVATPPWPVISTAVMYDDNGDIIPDLLSLTINDTFHVNQQLDSVIIDYRGNSYPFAAASLTLRQQALSIPFTSLSGVDPQPSGQVTLVMTVEGEKKRVTKEFSDGVGPALTAVSLVQDLSANDTLKLSFTEDVVMQTLIGPTLQLIRAATGDTAVLTVLSYWGPAIYGTTDVVVSSPGGIRPQEGDLLRLVPGVKGGKIVDTKKNLPHLLNRPVAIPQRPAQLTGGYYVDENADGVVEAVYLQFRKPVPLDSIAISLTWGTQRADNLVGTNLSYGADHATVRIALPDVFTSANGVKTSGIMYVRVQFTAYVNEVRVGEAVDRAAPVIAGATFKVGATVNADMPTVDTLIVTFSEKARVASTAYPFSLLRNAEIPYTFSLQLLSLDEQAAVFVVKGIEGVTYPESGDSVFINPASAVGDSMTWQNNPANRRVPLLVQRGALKWDVVVFPNPFNPDQHVGNIPGTSVRIVNPGNFNMPINISDARINIYDAVGNPVVKSTLFEKGASGLVYQWNGTNQKGRKVGEGTYIGIVTVNDEGAEGVKRVKIGVLRRGIDTH